MKNNKNHNRAESFKNAFNGIFSLMKFEPNARIHLAATFMVIFTGLWLRIGLISWGLLIFAIGIVWIAELLNSAVEYTVDLVTEEYHEKAKIAKDMAAGGVLIAAITAALIGLLVMGPPLLAIIFG